MTSPKLATSGCNCHPKKTRRADGLVLQDPPEKQSGANVFKVPAEQRAGIETPELEDAGLAEARMAVRDQCIRG